MAEPSALLVCNGDPPAASLVRRLARGASLVVAADGGAEACRRCGVRPDVIIGDLDSLRTSTRRFFRASRVIRIRRQDNTDLEKALDYLREGGVRQVTIAGAAGRRVDFTLANLAVLCRYASSMRIRCVGPGWYAVPVWRHLELKEPRGRIVSLVPFGTCRGVTLSGLRYPLRDAVLPAGRAAVSNVVRGKKCIVEIRSGRLLVLVLEGKARA
ncbi:MAG: thiamine diphosphokinase [Bacteroidota bacterium]